MAVSFRVAQSSGDYRAVHSFLRDHEQETGGTLSFPTLMVIEEQDLIGVLGTSLEQNVVLAGPLVVENAGPRLRLVAKVIDTYDAIMRSLGIKSYIHAVENSNKKWLSFIERTYGGKKYAETDSHSFFLKEI